ncbi:MAG: GNAT family N-acetyltransferase [Armatimonadetes bacterium]|nr:GNAT family N-acetyltransferase [Armatimonadota bacterium]
MNALGSHYAALRRPEAGHRRGAGLRVERSEMAVEIREFTDADEEWAAGVWSIAFRDGLPLTKEEVEPAFGEEHFVAERDGRPVGLFSVHSMTATRDGNAIPCAGIASVAVPPEERRSGVAEAMMNWCANELRHRGFAIGSLYAFSEAYYRKFGWECAGHRVSITCPSSKLPESDDVLPIARHSYDAWPQAKIVYDAFAKRYSGMNCRSDEGWDKMRGKSRDRTLLFLAGDPPEAYAMLVLSPWREKQFISECAWTTARGHRSLLALFRALGVNRDPIEWYEPSDSPFLASFLDYGVEVSLTRPVMYRVFDVPKAISYLRPTTSGEFTIRVADSFAGGTWRVKYDPAGIVVTQADHAEIRMSLGHFTQALLGEPSLSDLARQGLAEADPVALQSAVRLFTPHPTYCMDFF